MNIYENINSNLDKDIREVVVKNRREKGQIIFNRGLERKKIKFLNI